MNSMLKRMKGNENDNFVKKSMSDLQKILNKTNHAMIVN